MRLDRALSGEFEIKKGVKQGSVLPPTPAFPPDHEPLVATAGSFRVRP